MENLYEKLIEHNKKNIYPMHMPGHKRNVQIMDMINPYCIDITEIDGFDNMHNPKEIIKKIEEEASEVYGVKKTFLSVSGTSMGIVAAIFATAVKKGKILMARNCHKSVYNAVELMELKPRFIYPKVDEYGMTKGIELIDVKRKIQEDPDICVVVVTNPTYEGMLTNIEKISEFLHEKKIPLIVDAAHGAHLGLNECFAKNSVEGNADIVIHSIHKTLPAFTQTSLVHIVNDSLVNIDRLKKYMSFFQSSSPSYILMAGIEKCIKVVREGEGLFIKTNNYLEKFYRDCEKLSKIKILDYKDKTGKVYRDKSKIIIVSTCSDYRRYGGKYIYDRLLHEFNIQLEMKSLRYALAMTSICDTEEGFYRLFEALVNIDKDLEKLDEETKMLEDSVCEIDILNVDKDRSYDDLEKFSMEMNCYQQYPPSKLDNLLITKVKLEESVEKICAEYVYLYPPGIPLIIPGEIISNKLLEIIDKYLLAGFDVEGLEDNMKCIKIVSDKNKKDDSN